MATCHLLATLKANSLFVQDTQQDTWLLTLKHVLHCRDTAQNAVKLWSTSGLSVLPLGQLPIPYQRCSVGSECSLLCYTRRTLP